MTSEYQEKQLVDRQLETPINEFLAADFVQTTINSGAVVASGHLIVSTSTSSTVVVRMENIQVFNEWIASHRAHDVDKLVTFLTDDVTIQSSAGKNMPPANGKEEARAHWQTIYNTFPDRI